MGVAVADNSNKLIITQEQNAGNPLRQGLRPLLTFDVWEHAYYLDFQTAVPTIWPRYGK